MINVPLVSGIWLFSLFILAVSVLFAFYKGGDFVVDSVSPVCPLQQDFCVAERMKDIFAPVVLKLNNEGLSGAQIWVILCRVASDVEVDYA